MKGGLYLDAVGKGRQYTEESWEVKVQGTQNYTYK